MRIVRYLDDKDKIRHGAEQADGRVLEVAGDLFGELMVSGREATIRRRRAPIVPAAILGIGLNYRRHAEETKATPPAHPVLFMKMPSAIQDPGQPIVLPASSEQVDYECELAVVIGKKAKNVPVEKALDVVLGYACANDVSARDWQIRHGGGQWCRGKTFDTFCPLGPVLVTKDEIPNPNDLAIKTIINGETLQDWTTGDMIFSVPELIAFLSRSTTLLPGTVILTGTPHGVGMARSPQRWLRPGDEVTIEIDKIGRLTNPVVAES